MGKLKVRKEIAEQVKNKLKTQKNDIFNTDFAEKTQNQQVTSKLQANKNLFHRGQFDAYKIENMGVAPDGCVYDLDNPTEKFYYDLKVQFAKADNEVEKGIRTVVVPPSNGRKGYQYNRVFTDNKKENRYLPKEPVEKEEQRLMAKIKNIFDSQSKAEKSLIKSDIKDCTKNYEFENVSIPIHPSRLPENQNKYDKPKTIVELKVAGIFKKKGFNVYIPKERHNEHGKKNVDFIINGVRFELKTVSGNLNTTQQRYSDALDQSKNIILSFKSKKDVPDFMRKQAALNGARLTNKKQQCLIFVFEKEKEITFYNTDRIKKSILNNQDAVKGEPESSKNVGISPTSIFSNIDNNLSSKNVTKSLTISDRLFRLWQRRLSPELQKEMQKYVDEHSRVYSLFSGYKDVYDIKGYPKGLDLENNILLELGDTYFVVSCGGDWQDEKLVKFSIGEDDKLKAEVVDKCDKEDKRVLNKKLAYIINPETINKSLFTDWKVELHHLCDKKGLDYDSVIQKYDDKLTRYVAEEQLHQDAENVIAYKAYKDLNKSLTYSGHKLQGRTRLYGMDISIENKKGSYRSGTDKDGHKWRTYMNYDYGYIRGTVGTDKDHLDCYVGPDKEAQKVYIIHQNDPVTHKYDEDKCMLCFSSAADAKAAYMKQYDRPGFYGSMTTMTIDQFKTFIFSHKGKMVHKTFDIQITDITENNKQQKLEQFNKALNAIADNRPFVIKHIPADNSEHYENLTVRLMDFDRNKIEKAVHKVALSLDADISGASKGESFVYKSQEEIVDKYFKEFTDRTRAIYNFVISYFDLPDIRIVSKAGELRHKGKILYNPETGNPIKESDWKKFVVELEKFLNRNYSGIGEKIVLSAESLGIILDRLSKTNSLEAIRKMSVADLKAKRYDVDWISDSVKNMKDKFGEVISRERQARIQIAMDSAAQRVTRVKDDMRNNIQQIIIDGIRDKQSKSVVAQNLFDKCASLNRDMQRIADSEVQMAANSSYCKEEVYNSEPGEKVYFKRFEIIDDNTCKQCKKLNGTIVLWSDVPLPDEHIKDPYAKYAIWEGKNEGDCPVGILHPWCRGSWIRYYPDVD